MRKRLIDAWDARMIQAHTIMVEIAKRQGLIEQALLKQEAHLKDFVISLETFNNSFKLFSDQLGAIDRTLLQYSQQSHGMLGATENLTLMRADLGAAIGRASLATAALTKLYDEFITEMRKKVLHVAPPKEKK